MACIRFAACCHTADSRAVDDVGADLLAAVGGEAVQEPGVGAGGGHERLVDRVAGERGTAAGLLVLLAHRGPHVGVDGVDAGDGVVGVGDELDGPAEVAGPLDELVLERVPGR